MFTSEYVGVESIIPHWLEEAVVNQDITDVKIIYPSEVSRKEAMHRFQDMIDGAGQVDPNQHLTI